MLGLCSCGPLPYVRVGPVWARGAESGKLLPWYAEQMGRPTGRAVGGNEASPYTCHPVGLSMELCVWW